MEKGGKCKTTKCKTLNRKNMGSHLLLPVGVVYYTFCGFNQSEMKFFFLFNILLSLSCMQISPLKVYEVKRLNASVLTIDGQGSDPAWQEANLLTDFSYPWREDEAPATHFRALWDEAYLYFLYRANDPQIITKMDTALSLELQAVNSDRVEIFFKADDEMNPYYSLEMDALGRVLDTEGRFYREIDMDWNWPEGELTVMASRDEEGYWLEGKVSFASLQQLGMMKPGGREIQAGLYRGEYLQDAAGNREVRWISWVQPDAEKPDFHIPSSFGLLVLR
jgi:hypothetical protein